MLKACVVFVWSMFSAVQWLAGFFFSKEHYFEVFRPSNVVPVGQPEDYSLCYYLEPLLLHRIKIKSDEIVPVPGLQDLQHFTYSKIQYFKVF